MDLQHPFMHIHYFFKLKCTPIIRLVKKSFILLFNTAWTLCNLIICLAALWPKTFAPPILLSLQIFYCETHEVSLWQVCELYNLLCYMNVTERHKSKNSPLIFAGLRVCTVVCGLSLSVKT